MLYALGLERMLSPRRGIPLPHAMTSYLQTNSNEDVVILESDVALEISNRAGQVVTITRSARAQTDNRIIRVTHAAALTNPGETGSSRDYFVWDPGAASREDGFHRFLEDFLGWSLPTVRRYDATDAKLYLETVFPLFWVEQKVGWSAIPASIPTYFRIRDVQKRAVEFIINLDAYKDALRRQKLQELIGINAREWRIELEKLDNALLQVGGRHESLPKAPTAISEELGRARLMVEEDGWKPLREAIEALRARVSEILAASIPDVATSSEHLAQELQRLNSLIEGLNSERVQIHNVKQLKLSDVEALRRRIASLDEDLQKNLDVQKIQRYSGITSALTPDRCPTCEQSLHDTLLSQEAIGAIMPIEDNIEYLRSQLRMFKNILEREVVAQRGIEVEASKLDRQLSEVYSRVRAVRTDLVSPGGNPSAAVIEERVRAEGRIRELENSENVFWGSIERLAGLSREYAALLEEQSKLSLDLTDDDIRKVRKLTLLVQEQVEQYGFKTFKSTEISIAEDSYKPEKEGFEIGFETSASDAIRLKWAYQLGLLELASEENTNHPGFLLFDEPRQQSSSKVSFANLLRRAALAKERDQQVIFFTSEDLSNFEQMTSGLECQKLVFPGFILQRLS